MWTTGSAAVPRPRSSLCRGDRRWPGRLGGHHDARRAVTGISEVNYPRRSVTRAVARSRRPARRKAAGVRKSRPAVPASATPVAVSSRPSRRRNQRSCVSRVASAATGDSVDQLQGRRVDRSGHRLSRPVDHPRSATTEPRSSTCSALRDRADLPPGTWPTRPPIANAISCDTRHVPTQSAAAAAVVRTWTARHTRNVPCRIGSRC